MAKKKTTREQYAEILAERGIDFKGCCVLAYAFEWENDAEKLHYAAMLATPRPKYHLFDCVECRAFVVVSKDDEDSIQQLDTLALSLGGKKYAPGI